jgi:hypothetical protein
MNVGLIFVATAIALGCINPVAGKPAFSNRDKLVTSVQESTKQQNKAATDKLGQDQLLERIVSVLSSTADAAKKWDDKEVAARILAQIADLIWDVNHEDAISYLKSAWEAAANLEEPKRDRSNFVNPSLRNAVRREVLMVARKCSPELATRWLEEMIEETKEGENKDRGTFDDRSARSAVLLQMANELVRDNPRAAAELVIESLRDGISFNFQNVLIRIQQQDATLAETVFRAALARLRTAGMSDPNELLTLYSYLFTPGRVHGANTSDNRNQVQLVLGGPRLAIQPARQNPAMALEFLEIASDLLLAAPLTGNAQLAARSITSVIGAVLREVTTRLPEKAALLRARVQQLDSQAAFSTTPVEPSPDIPDSRPGESKESFAERRVDLLEEAAAKGRDSLTRNIGYAKAAVATTVERYERGLELAGKIDDKELREGVRSWLFFRAVLDLIASGKLTEAYRLNLRNDDAAQRAVGFVVGAQRLVNAHDTDRANEWLRQAGNLIRKGEPNENLTRIAFGIVSTYGDFDIQASLDWFLFAVNLMQKASPAFLNDDKAPSFKRITGITPNSELTRQTSGFSLRAAVAVFPSEQFEQVLSMLTDVTPQEARGIAVVTLCSTFLKTLRKPTTPSQPSPSLPTKFLPR